ncbi:haloalkane dehalogenase [Nonomuraea sp. NPDC002799]
MVDAEHASPQGIQVLRTPEERFEGLADYPFAPHYVEIDANDGAGTRLRVHYVDERPSDPAKASGETVLLLHGEPTWSYIYRHIIPPLVAAGHRCVAPDLVGFGKSDKAGHRFDYTYQRHVGWLTETVLDRLDLHDITLVGQDWGGLLGIRMVAENPDRFRRVLATNTSFPTGEEELVAGFAIWLQLSQRSNPFDIAKVIDRGTVNELDPAVGAAYNAPFPDESYLQGARQFPLLIPITPFDEAAIANRKAWEVLENLRTPFLVAFSDRDYGVGGGPDSLRNRIAGAAGQAHTTIENAGHFVQEDKGPELTAIIDTFINSTR